MVSWLPSIPYEPMAQSIWEPATSTINFCEEDFYLTGYVAEVMNVGTNGLYIWLSYKGLSHVFKHDHPRIFAICFISYGIIGIGSMLFHGTLKYSMQLVDECAMIYTALTMCFATFSHGRSTLMQALVLLGCVGTGLGITLTYHYLKNPLFHQTAFAFIMISLLSRSMFMMETRTRPKNPAAANIMWKMVLWGIFVFLAGFGVWNIDNIYCQQLRGWRREVGMPWGFVSELHAWWHLLTGIGSYILLVWGQYLRAILDGKGDEYDLNWPSLLSVPSVDKKAVKKGISNGKAKHANGSATNGVAANGANKKTL
ncbi:hypothetical protein H072_3170 [Dactylellina haptotyla CBS 200.50]|uniref:Alkaline phytoceramidase n=1 Tax=Dactylellina haptotyla (strain CBS 200.50) TaxID=1284197 RepID=S8BTY4_DACHA|nr:hypothetical protein H072_3170 [Dactylellina haptotyla CBS 200.50]